LGRQGERGNGEGLFYPLEGGAGSMRGKIEKGARPPKKGVDAQRGGGKTKKRPYLTAGGEKSENEGRENSWEAERRGSGGAVFPTNLRRFGAREETTYKVRGRTT